MGQSDEKGMKTSEKRKKLTRLGVVRADVGQEIAVWRIARIELNDTSSRVVRSSNLMDRYPLG